MALARLLSKYEIDVSVAEWYLSPGENIDKKVLKQIENSDCIVVLLTKNGIRSNWVHQEIGYSIKIGKKMIPLVESGVAQKDLGLLANIEYIEYDPYNPQEALLKLSSYVKSLKLKKEEQKETLLVVGGLLAFLLLLSGEQK